MVWLVLGAGPARGIVQTAAKRRGPPSMSFDP
jgi:hypothetical protein